MLCKRRPPRRSRRVYLAGRLDLTQAEAVADLIYSSTLERAREAARKLGGALSRQVQPIKEALILLSASLEAAIDFAETTSISCQPKLSSPRSPHSCLRLKRWSAAFPTGGSSRRFPPRARRSINAGRSSLFNRLFERDRAIVTATPGTTRDVIVERMSLNGIPVDLSTQPACGDLSRYLLKKQNGPASSVP